ncbi:MAG: hypothetical protein ACRD15_01970, partial [Vicinamibacterales bacterium]
MFTLGAPRSAIAVITVYLVLSSVSALAQTTSREPFVVGQGSFATNGGWITYRGDGPEYESSVWSQVPWPNYIATGGAVHPAMGDVDGDGLDEVVIGLGSGANGWIAVLDDRAHGNVLLAWVQVPFAPYNL